MARARVRVRVRVLRLPWPRSRSGARRGRHFVELLGLDRRADRGGEILHAEAIGDGVVDGVLVDGGHEGEGDERRRLSAQQAVAARGYQEAAQLGAAVDRLLLRPAHSRLPLDGLRHRKARGEREAQVDLRAGEIALDALEVDLGRGAVVCGGAVDPRLAAVTHLEPVAEERDRRAAA
eukprot:scaffold67384_cov57-Phaeocystis_antarctica.AAC.2